MPDDSISKRPRVTVVIPTWNHSTLLGECLASLERQVYRPFSVLVVDDGSTEDISGFVAAQFPKVRTLKLSENCGFATAINSGIRDARGELIFLLNNDMTLEEKCLGCLVDSLEANEADMAAPLVLWRDDRDRIYSAGDVQRVDGRPESAGHRAELAGFDVQRQVFGISAGAGLYRRAVFDEVGLFDERFVAYFEDSDLNFRARLAGFSAVCAEDAIAYHVGSASMGGRVSWRARQCYRNHTLLVLKNMPATLLLRFGATMYREHLHQVGRVFSTVRAEAGALRALWALAGESLELLSLFPHALAERRRIQKRRRISSGALLELLKKDP